MNGYSITRELVDRDPRPVNRDPVVINDQQLLELVTCKVQRPFYVAGKLVNVGELVKLARHDAASLAAIGRVKLAP